MQELLVQEQIELELHVCLLEQMTLLKCHVTEDKLPNLQPKNSKVVMLDQLNTLSYTKNELLVIKQVNSGWFMV